MNQIPDGWKVAALGDFLNEEQAEKVAAILNKNGGDMDANIRELKDYFSTFKGELESKGMNWEFLAYTVGYHLTDYGRKK